MANRNDLLGGTDWTDGDILYAADLNDTIDAIGMVPVGSVMSWLKDFTNTPALNEHFVECNGQVLSDADSVFNGQTIPDLNGGEFVLQGKSTSGTETDLVHTHGITQDTHTHEIPQFGTGQVTGGANADVTNDNSAALQVQYSVVWIIRIK